VIARLAVGFATLNPPYKVSGATFMLSRARSWLM